MIRALPLCALLTLAAPALALDPMTGPEFDAYVTGRTLMYGTGGDPYGGDCALDQSLLWRPLRATRNHATPIAHLWHIGASTHPGPGLGGGSGFHVAQALGAA